LIKDTTDINTRTNEGRLALALLAVVTTQSHQSKTPDDVIASVQTLITKMFEGEPEITDGLRADLSQFFTRELVDELRKRSGVDTAIVDVESTYGVDNDGILELEGEGPAIILVVTD